MQLQDKIQPSSLKRILLVILLSPLMASAQINTDRVMLIGRNALYYDDYVLAIQYFNEVINAKPFLYDPYYFRAVAKFYLEDWQGAEYDCTKAIDLNPFIEDSYQLRGLCRIKQENYKEAIEDYSTVIKYKPLDQASWYNRLLCEIQLKDYDKAGEDIKMMHKTWPKYLKAYELEAQICLMTKDTLRADSLYARIIEKDKDNGDAWGARGMIALSKGDLRAADSLLTAAIKYSPDVVVYYIDRALINYKFNQLRAAMNDYDKALDLDPENFPAHYNRGLLRAEVGEDNKAIEDFNFVLKLEPDNLLALFNRAVLYEKTGYYKGAIADVSRVISQYPHFWTGYALRARCRRRSGNVKGAASDEKRLLIADLDRTFNNRHYATKSIRNRKEKNIEDYHKLVVEDDTASITKYSEEYRGKVQYRKVEATPKPIFSFTSSSESNNVIGKSAYYWRGLEKWCRKYDARESLMVTNAVSHTDKELFDYYNNKLSELAGKNDSTQIGNMFIRAVIYSDIKDYRSALYYLGKCTAKDSISAPLYFQTAAVKQYALGFISGEKNAGTSHGDVLFSLNSVCNDLEKALKLMPGNEFILYNLGCAYFEKKDFAGAESYFSKAIKINSRFAEAYYNRALSRLQTGKKEEAASDLSHAGELGLYDAYSILRQNRLK